MVVVWPCRELHKVTKINLWIQVVKKVQQKQPEKRSYGD